ncbi:MAG: nuclear transport factor 2 family protein [Bacteroidota bacterium]
MYSYLVKLSTLLLLIATAPAYGQTPAPSEEEKILAVINDYIEGTAYNNPEQLLSAFLPGANMFLDKQGEPLFVRTIEEYAKGVGKGEKGVFNGRVTNVLSVDQFEGIATAKLEVIIPGFGRRFIDMLLLKKLTDGWKIISKTAGSEASNRQGDKVLIVTSSASKHGQENIATGNSFSEVCLSYFEYQTAGYHVDFVSPKGGKIPLSYIDPSDEEHMNALYNPDFMYAIAQSKKPSQIDPSQYDIILYTGGSAPIFDIPQNADIQNIAAHIYEQNNGIVAAVCHGTAGIVNIRTSNGSYLIQGKKVNGFPEEFENKKSKVYQNFPFIIQNKVEENGGTFTYGEKAKPYHIVDGRLVTGQNFRSSKVVAQKSIELHKKMEGTQENQ